MIQIMDKHSYILMINYVTKDKLKIFYLTVKAHIFSIMVIIMQENSKQVIVKVMELKLIQMDIVIKVNGKMIKNKEKDNIS